MSNFTKNSITVQGAVAIAALVAGGTLEFTRIQVGDGTLPASSSPMSRTSLVNPLFDVNINEVYSDSESQATVTGVFSNAQTQTGFFYRELGLFAKDPATGAEILFCYGNAGDEAEWINAAGEGSVIEKEVHIVTLVGNATEVTATLKSGIYPTIEMTQKWLGLKADLDATAAEGGRVLASQMRFDEIQDLYVDAAASATGADGSEAKPFKTITAALAAFYAGARVVRIKVKAGTYNEAVTVQNAPGTLFHFTRNGEGTVSIKTLTAIYAQVYASDMTFSGDAEGNTVTLANVGNFAFQRVTVAGTSSTSGVASYNSNGFLESVTINGCGTAFEARDGSHVALRSVGGTGNDVGVAAFESVVTLADHKLKATTPYVTANGGAINDSYGTTTFPSNFHPGYYLGDMSTMDALRNALLAEFKKLQSGSSRFVSFAGNIPGGIGEFAEGQMMNATITKTSESGNGYGYVIFSAHNGPIFGYMQIGEGAFKTQTPISLAKWQVISDGKTNVLELPTGIYSMMNVTAAQNLPGTQSGTLIVDKNVGSKHLTFFVDIEPKIFSRTQYKTGVWADWVQYAPYATTEEYGLVRLASEVDVLNEVDEVVMDVPLSYELNDFRRMNKAYAVGDKVNCAFRFEFFLECTKAGTTSGETLDTRKVTFGQVITDGTVKWTVRAHAKSVNGVVPDKNGNIAIDLSGYATKTEVDALTTLTDDGLQTLSGVDYNTVVNPGFYAIPNSGSTNQPAASAFRMIVLSSSGSNYVTQLAVPIYDKAETGADVTSVYFRSRNGNGDTWSKWRQLALTDYAREYGGIKYGVGGGLNTSPSGSAAEIFNSQNFDDWNKSGFFTVSVTNGQNTPTGSTSVTGIMLNLIRRWETGTSGLQIMPVGSTVYYRSKSNAAWNPWYAFARDDLVVHNAGNETIGGVKTFANPIVVTGSTGMNVKREDVDYTTTPAYDVQYWLMRSQDKNGKPGTVIKHYYRMDGSQETQIANIDYVGNTNGYLCSIVMGRDADGVYYLKTSHSPQDADNGTQIATARWVNDRIKKSTYVVHTTGTETVAGSKTFTNPILSSSATLIRGSNWANVGIADESRTTSSTRMMAELLDKDGKRFAGLEVNASATGARIMQFVMRNRADTGWVFPLQACEEADGTTYILAPQNPASDDNSTKVATTKYVNDKINAITAISTSQINSICV